MQNARQLDIPRLIAFIAVCEEGSISAASRRLHIAQPALTVTMAKLESALGTKLLERDIRGVTPTPSGAELLARAYDIVGRAQAASETSRPAPASRRGKSPSDCPLRRRRCWRCP